MLPRVPEDFDLDFEGGDEIGPPPEVYLDALGAAIAAGDAAAYAELQVRFLAPTVTEERAETLRSMFTDTFAALSSPLRWVPHPGVWLEDIAGLDVPVLLLAPPFGGSAALSARVAQLAADAAPRAELVTYTDTSELPWLSAPEQLVGPMVGFLAGR
jgi:pimeloyl-ACP methyl ester carboxylesterase